MGNLNLSKLWRDMLNLQPKKITLDDPFSIFVQREYFCNQIYKEMLNQISLHSETFNLSETFQVNLRADVSSEEIREFKKMYDAGLVDFTVYCAELVKILKDSDCGTFNICHDTFIFNKERQFVILVELLPEE